MRRLKLIPLLLTASLAAALPMCAGGCAADVGFGGGYDEWPNSDGPDYVGGVIVAGGGGRDRGHDDHDRQAGAFHADGGAHEADRGHASMGARAGGGGGGGGHAGGGGGGGGGHAGGGGGGGGGHR